MPALPVQFQRSLVRQRWPLLLFAVAFVIRAHWNLVVHPPGDFLYSDMRSYVLRADHLLDRPDDVYRYAAFYPWGTHVLVAGLKALFGRENWTAIGLAYAGLGATIAPLTYLVAQRASTLRWVPLPAALVVVFYYPLISLGGYVLSEVPFSTLFMLALWCFLRWIDSGRAFDAAVAGLAFTVAAVFRPQALASLVAGLAFLAFVPAARARLRRHHLAAWVIPIVLVLGYSAHRFHTHTGRLGIVSDNGSLNLVFGRCHVGTVVALPHRPGARRIRFRPPPFLQMQQRARRGDHEWPQLDPALGETFRYRGYIGDSEVHHEFVRRCVQATGWRGQLRYAVDNAALLFRGNIPWPDSSRAPFSAIAETWRKRTERWLLIPTLLALTWPFLRRRPFGMRLLAVNVWVILALGAVFFGSIRIRSPYDPVLIILATEFWSLAVLWSSRRGKRLLNRWLHRT